MAKVEHSKLAIVTGGGSGLGREFCTLLASRNWHVVVADIDADGAAETTASIQVAGGQAQVAQLDVTDLQAWLQLVVRLRSRWPRLDLLVNNAGICAAGKIGESPLEDFRRVCEVNLFGVINGCHAVMPWMREMAPGGAIVNIASVAAFLSAPAMAAYNVSKAGVVSFSETLRAEVESLGIGVTVVLPGFFASRLLERGTFYDQVFLDLAQEYTASSTTSAAQIARLSLQAVEQRKSFLALGKRVRLAWRLKRLAPNSFQRFVAWRFSQKESSNSAHVMSPRSELH